MYCGDAQCANYDKQRLIHYFGHGAYRVYNIYSVLKLFEIPVGFAHLSFFEICTPLIRTVLTMTNSLNHYFPHGARCVYHIYGVLKLFEIAVCFAHFSFFEIYTAVMRTVITMAKRV